MSDLDAKVGQALDRIRDGDPEGNAFISAWETRGAPGWQAAIIRLARPALLWMLGVVVMGIGPLIVGIIEAIWPGAGVRMAAAMASMLKAYPGELYILIGTIFLGQAATTIASARRKTS